MSEMDPRITVNQWFCVILPFVSCHHGILPESDLSRLHSGIFTGMSEYGVCNDLPKSLVDWNSKQATDVFIVGL